MQAQAQIVLSAKEIMGLYMLLKKQEMVLDATMCAALGKIEKILYAQLTVEEIESIQSLYDQQA